jgi:hypothetical protein
LIALRVRAKKAGLVPAFSSSGARVIVLFTDFGCCDPYLGQVKAGLHARAPRVPVLDALQNAPSFGIEPAAHLLAALAPFYPRGSVWLAVVDPGVGGPREGIVAQVDGRSFVGHSIETYRFEPNGDVVIRTYYRVPRRTPDELGRMFQAYLPESR